MRTPIESNLPWLVFALPTVAGLLIFALGRTSRWLREGLALVGLGATSVVAIQVGFQVVHGRALRAWGMNFYADGLSAVMELLGAVMGFLVVIYSIRYLPHETSDERASPHRQAIYYGLVLLFFGAMNWTCATNNLLMLWIALEATTLTSAFLVTYYWRRQPLEAGYNYLVMVTVGMVFGLFGYVLIYTAVAPHLGARSLAVHAVDVDADDLADLARSGATVVLCPRSNQAIGGRLPDLPRLLGAGVPLAVGTDSLASSPSLSPLAELAVLRRAFPRVDAGRLLALAWNGGAVGAPGVGRLEAGGAPGVIAAPLGGERPADPAAWMLEVHGAEERPVVWIARHRPEARA